MNKYDVGDIMRERVMSPNGPYGVSGKYKIVKVNTVKYPNGITDYTYDIEIMRDPSGQFKAGHIANGIPESTLNNMQHSPLMPKAKPKLSMMGIPEAFKVSFDKKPERKHNPHAGKCTCGGLKVGGGHSSWCDIDKKEYDYV